MAAKKITLYNDIESKPYNGVPNYGKDTIDNLQEISTGQGSKAFRQDRDGMWLGANKFADAPFSVSMQGRLIALNALIRGGLISGNIKLGGQDNIDGLLQLFNAAGVQISQIDNQGLVTFGLETGFRTAYNAAEYALGNITGFIGSSSNLDMTFRAGLGIQMVFSCSPNADFYMGIGESGEFKVHGSFDVTQNFRVRGSNFDIDGDTYIYTIGPDVYIDSGGVVKTAIVPTSQGYRALYCAESPDVWFFDFAKVKPRKWWQFWKKTEYDIDPLFLETVEGELTFIPTVSKDKVMVYGKRKGYLNTRMEQKTEAQFIKNNKFWRN